MFVASGQGLMAVCNPSQRASSRAVAAKMISTSMVKRRSATDPEMVCSIVRTA